jgi:CRISPR-associated protein Csm2
MKGKVKMINQGKGFGFITGEDGEDCYFNSDSLAEGFKFGDFTKDIEVEFVVQKHPRGPKATNCRIPENESVKFFKKYVLDLTNQKDVYDEFCDHANKYAERLKSAEVTTSMIRKIYSRILNAREATEVKLLRPQFAYTAGRNDNAILKEFMDLLDYLVKKMDVNDENELKNLKQFMEAIVAYRKYVGQDK